MTDRLLSVFVALGMAGAFLNSIGQPFWASAVWVVANLGLVFHNRAIREKRQAAMFGVYLVLAVWGLWTWC